MVQKQMELFAPIHKCMLAVDPPGDLWDEAWKKLKTEETKLKEGVKVQG